MKNLIDEIEKKKRSKGKYADEFIYGFNEGIEKTLSILNQYNIITAPKSIKLSEIVKKLNKNIEGSTFSFCRHNNEIDVWEDYKINDDEEKINGSTFIFTINSNSIIKMIARDDRIPKWLYTLWIAETEIVDDLECDNNENNN